MIVVDYNRKGYIMNIEELKKAVIEQVEKCKDADLLDLIMKLLLQCS